MEDEIDLRAYVEVLLRYWKWIAGLAVVAAIAAFVVTSFLPHTYEATSVVIVTQPRYQIQFDPRFDTQEGTPAYKAFPTLALSDGVLQRVVDNYTPPNGSGIEPWTLTALRGMVEATSEGDPSLVVLRVTAQSPKAAAAIANLWADTLVKQGNELYGQGTADVTFFETQAQQAQQALDQAEAALVEFEARNQSSTVTAQLDSLRQAQTDYLADQRAITYLVQDIQGLRGQLAGQTASQSVSLADSLTTLFLQIKAFNAQAETPIQLQVDTSAALSDKSPADQLAFLDDLVTTLEAKTTTNQNRLDEMEPQILTLQKQLQEITVESDQLVRTRDLARDTYVTLTRKLQEAQIAAQEQSGIMQAGSHASVPEEPAGPHRLVNTAIGGILGLFAGLAIAFSLAFIGRYRPASGGKGSE